MPTKGETCQNQIKGGLISNTLGKIQNCTNDKKISDAG